MNIVVAHPDPVVGRLVTRWGRIAKAGVDFGRLDTILDEFPQALKKSQDAAARAGLLKQRRPKEVVQTEKVVTNLMNEYNDLSAEALSEVRKLPDSKEKERAIQNVKKVDHFFTFGGRGLVRERDPNEMRSILQRAKTIWREVEHLLAGQRLLFATSPSVDSVLSPGVDGPSDEQTHDLKSP